MLYLLAVLTFLAGILFYGLSPRDDNLQQNVRQAEGMIVAFVDQHQAAKDYLYTWLGAAKNSGSNSGNIQNDGSLKAELGGNPIANFENYLPKNLISSMCADNSGTPGTETCTDGDVDSPQPIAGFVSRVMCVNELGNELDCNDANVRKRYVYTFGGWGPYFEAPSWWPNENHPLRRYEGWRRAIANRTRGSANCGTLWEKEVSSYCIDNGSTCKGTVPSVIINQLQNLYNSFSGRNKNQAGIYLNDLLFCYSEFDQGIERYASGANSFYDGISNVAVAQYGESTIGWKNLAGNDSIANVSTSNGLVTTSANNYYSFGALNFSDPNEAFTINVIAHPDPTEMLQAKGMDLIALRDSDNNIIYILRKEPSTANYNAGEEANVDVTSGRLNNGTIEIDAFCLHTDNMKYCFSAKDYQLINGRENEYKSDGKISWTLVKSGNNLTLYEGATKKMETNLATNPINHNGNLIVGNSSNGVLYAVRIWPYALSPEQIANNTSVDFRRFGFVDPSLGYDYNKGRYLPCPEGSFRGLDAACYECDESETIRSIQDECDRCQNRTYNSEGNGCDKGGL